MHHGVHVYGRSQDEEVRVAAIVDDAGDTYHVAVTLSDGGVAVDAALSQQSARGVFLPFVSDESLLFGRLIPQGEVRCALDERFQAREFLDYTRRTFAHGGLIQPSNAAMELTTSGRYDSRFW